MSKASKKSAFLLTWRELAEADDFLTHNLLDNAHYWTQSRKVQDTPPASLEIARDMVLKLLRRYVIDALKPQTHKCVGLLMEHQVTKRFLARYGGDETKKAGFTLLCWRYVESYMPDCCFEISTTDRFGRFYGIEGCVVARKAIEAGSEIKYLTGSLAPLAEKEEDELKTELSILTIASLNATCLMLGPCRFINHNCEANAKFEKSSNGIKICAKKKILPGEEITIEYASNYFGKRNRNCLCAACERNQIGFFHPDRQQLKEHHLEELSDSEDEITHELNATQPIVLESEGDEDLEEEKSPSPLDEEEPEVNPARVTKVEPLNAVSQRLPKLGLDNLRMAMVRDAVMPSAEDTKVVGGRSLRKRDHRRVVVSNDATILDYYPLDDSLDSLALSDDPPDKELSLQRQTLRTLHKLYMLELYKDTADFSQIYDCLNCGVYFKLVNNHRYKEYCPRCVRHYELFKLAWPDTIVVDIHQTKTLELDASRNRPPIKYLMMKWGKLMKQEQQRRDASAEASKANSVRTRSQRKAKGKAKKSNKRIPVGEPRSVKFSGNNKVFEEFSSSSSEENSAEMDESDDDDVSRGSVDRDFGVQNNGSHVSSDDESSDGTPYALPSSVQVRSSPRIRKRVLESSSPPIRTTVLKRARSTKRISTRADSFRKQFELARIRNDDNIMSNDPSDPLDISDSSNSSDWSDSDDDSTELLGGEIVPNKEGIFPAKPILNRNKAKEVGNGAKSRQSSSSSNIPSSPESLKPKMSSNVHTGSPITDHDHSADDNAPPKLLEKTSMAPQFSKTASPSTIKKSSPANDYNRGMATKRPTPLKQRVNSTTPLKTSPTHNTSDSPVRDWQSEIMRLEKSKRKYSVNGVAHKREGVKVEPPLNTSIGVSSVKAGLDGTTQTSAQPSPRPGLNVPSIEPFLPPRPRKSIPQAKLQSNRKPLSLPKKEIPIIDLTTDLSGVSGTTVITIDDDKSVVIENGKEIILLDVSE